MREWDYIVVGAGSAGCTVAARLSEDGSSVLLLEAGPKDWHPMIHVPAGILNLLQNPRVNWNYSSEPEDGTAGRRIHWPRGRVLGGSSSINGMLYVRGNRADYDTWSQMGCRGWSYDDVLPMFRKSERYAGGEDEFRGREGPLVVEEYNTILPITHRFVKAAQQAGFTLREDLNGREQEGVGYSQMTRNQRFRASTARTYLAQAKGRPNLDIETEAIASRVLFEGSRCVGVRYVQRGMTHDARAGREVIVSGGAVNSPHLLQISGIGPAEHLQSIGAEVVADLPGVGANLQDHYVVRLTHRIRGELSINELARGWRRMREVVRWVATGTGALTFGVTAAMVFTRSRAELASPDLQLLFTPASYDPAGFGVLEDKPGATVAICPTRPDSRGTIMAANLDPSAPPVINPGYLSAESDYDVLRAGIELSRSIFAQPPLAEVSEGETAPGEAVHDDATIRAFARENGVTLYHPVGTCKMGTDAMAVVDPRLRVRGITGLRVVDASVMPTLTTGNTNAPTIMIGEKAAAMIREDARANGSKYP